jgi:laminin gamma 1
MSIVYLSSYMYSHKQEADDIVRVAKTANETSAEAYNLLLRTLAGENQTALEIEELNRK